MLHLIPCVKMAKPKQMFMSVLTGVGVGGGGEVRGSKQGQIVTTVWFVRENVDNFGKFLK